MSDKQNVDITLRRSFIGTKPKQRKILRALGLSKIGETVRQPDTPSIWGMIEKVKHMVSVSGSSEDTG